MQKINLKIVSLFTGLFWHLEKNNCGPEPKENNGTKFIGRSASLLF